MEPDESLSLRRAELRVAAAQSGAAEESRNETPCRVRSAQDDHWQWQHHRSTAASARPQRRLLLRMSRVTTCSYEAHHGVPG